MTEKAIQYLEDHFDAFTEQLIDYAKIESVSFPGYPPEPVEAAARWTAEKMKSLGLENVQILKMEGAHPYVYGDWLKAPGKPTLLLYGHHDVQPPGRDSHWQSPPFQPTLREGRLYGRGVADDKAGVLMHLAALEAYFKTAKSLPLNVKVIIEGEEETGSEHLKDFLNQYQSLLKSDAMVLTDTANLEEGLPSITYRLRGIVDCTLEVRTLDHPVHSGMWGGPAVDAITVLSKIIARLTNEKGEIAIPDFYEGVLSLDVDEKQKLKALPFDEKKFRQDLASVSQLQLAGEKDFSVYERLWCRPSIAVLGMDSQDVATTSNKIVEWARAKISIRIVAHQDPQKTMQRLCDFLEKDPPFGAEVKVIPGVANEAWRIDPQGPAFSAAARALEKGFERPAAFIGCGGSIPFVKPITEVFGGIPALLIGIEDPLCNAHGENESLSLSDWKKGMRSAVYLYEELSRVL
ncbi:MAG: M20/M25/M40 family metallo-hydrolase [Deltaproteobacteria bacterium]|nr:M20/M25/M40 family metallo-hydrolase [Deltaproteobacteria bacterium]